MQRLRVVASEWIGEDHGGSLASLERLDAKGNIVEHFRVAGKKDNQDHGATCREAARRLRILADRFEQLAKSDSPTCMREQEAVNFEPDTLIGRSLNDAGLVAMERGYSLRIVGESGHARVGRRAFDPRRINVIESLGRVARVHSVG